MCDRLLHGDLKTMLGAILGMARGLPTCFLTTLHLRCTPNTRRWGHGTTVVARLFLVAWTAVTISSYLSQGGGSDGVFHLVLGQEWQKHVPCHESCQKWAPCCAKTACWNQPFACMVSEGCNDEYTFSDTSCTARPMCKSFREEFDDPGALVDKYNYTGNPDDARFWREYPGADNAYIDDGNLILELLWSERDGKGQGATIPSVRWLQYGTVEARIKAAPEMGVVTSFITKTDISDSIGDEIDYELLGAHPTEVQTNFYLDGQLDYTKGKRWYFDEDSTTTTDDYHVYKIEWTPSYVRWSVDDHQIRYLENKGDGFPSEMSRVFFSVWDGGCNTAAGTQDWAGGETAWCHDTAKRGDAYRMYIDWVQVECYVEDDRDPDDYVPYIFEERGPDNDDNGDGTSGGSGTSGRRRRRRVGGDMNDIFNGSFAPLLLPSWLVVIESVVLAFVLAIVHLV